MPLKLAVCHVVLLALAEDAVACTLRVSGRYRLEEVREGIALHSLHLEPVSTPDAPAVLHPMHLLLLPFLAFPLRHR